LVAEVQAQLRVHLVEMDTVLFYLQHLQAHILETLWLVGVEVAVEQAEEQD
jgi:hypothetical protein